MPLHQPAEIARQAVEGERALLEFSLEAVRCAVFDLIASSGAR